MNQITERLGEVLLNRKEKVSMLQARLRGVRYGMFECDFSVAVRVNENETRTYGRFDARANFVPLTPEEYRELKKKYGDQVVPFAEQD